MKNDMSFGVLGGDKRQIALANGLLKDGYHVFIAGFDSYTDILELRNDDIETMITKSRCIILPVPTSMDNVNLNAPFCSKKIPINILPEKLAGKTVFCAFKDDLIKNDSSFKSIRMYEYATREDFAQANALPTAEGAVEVAIKEHPRTINGSKCLLCGFGRIGKALAPILINMGAKVTVSARKLRDILEIKELGAKPILTSDISKSSGYDIIFNTIPRLIFDENTLKSTAIGSLIIDLASMPGGIDDESAKGLNIKTIHALGLPGKIAPVAAGEIIKDTVYNMIKEGKL